MARVRRERGQRAWRDERHVAQADQRDAIARQRRERDPCGIAGSARRVLAHEAKVGRSERALDGLGTEADDHRDRPRRERAHGFDHVAHDRLAGQLVQHLRPRRMHALALAGGEDCDVEGGRHGLRGHLRRGFDDTPAVLCARSPRVVPPMPRGRWYSPYPTMAVIAVFNQKGGVGKTTTALNLLAALARNGRRGTGIDLDPQCHLSRVLDVEPRAAEDTLYGFFLHHRPLAEIAQITRSGIALVPAHLELAKLDALLGKGVNVVTRLRQALRTRDSLFHPVVIDCCPLLNALSLNAVFAADLVLVPVSADYLSFESARQVERALDALEPVLRKRLPRRYLITRYDARRKMSGVVAERMAAAFRPDEICVTRVRENVKLAESPAVGLDIFRAAPDSRGAHDYAALADELVGTGLLE